MSVVGLDIGNQNCFVAVARAGGIETIANEYSDRCTPAIVGFSNVQRIVGISAKNQLVSNFKNTVTQFKRLIGRKFDEPHVQAEIKRHPIDFVKKENGDIGVQVQYKNESVVFSPEQILAMLLTELKTTTEAEIKSKVTDCVISVPSYFTDYQRRRYLEAVQITGINCLKLMNDTTAIALTYGLFKQDLPTPEENPRHVAFVDCGHSSLQVCIAAFNKGKIKILSSASDPNIGGRDFDERLKIYFANAFVEKYKIDPRTSKRAWLRLDGAVDKIKKQLSSNTTDLPLNIECFMDDIDVTHRVNRAQFDEICQDLFERLDAPMHTALTESGLKNEEIDVIEVVGGSARIPALKAAIERIFKKPPSTTLNLDEAVARGCAIQCAMLSHTVKVRDIEVIDAAPYPINISWDSVKPDEPPGEMEVFKKHHSYPFTKLLTFPHRVQPFQFKAYYRDDLNIDHFEREIGQFTVNVASPTETADKVKVKVKLRLDIHGCFTVSSATQVERLPPPPETEQTEESKEEPMESTEQVNGEGKTETDKKDAKKEEPKNEEPKNEEPMDAESPKSETPKPAEGEKKSEKEKTPKKDKKDKKDKEDAPKPEPKKPKKLTKNTDLDVTKHQVGLSETEINLLVEMENELILTIRLEKERTEAKNAVEEYVYQMREKLYDEYETYITEPEQEKFSKLLSDTEDWLYEDGDTEKKQVYIEKLAEMTKLGQPIADRCRAYTGLPDAFTAFGSSLTHFRKILDLYTNKDEKYEHLEAAEIKKVQKKIDEKQDWFNKRMQENVKCKPTDSPVIFPSQLYSEKKILDDFCNPIVNKTKPKVEPPKEEPKEPKDASKDKSEKTEDPKAGETPAQTETGENMETEQNTDKSKENIDMEVD